jgi:hypothetical protein
MDIDAVNHGSLLCFQILKIVAPHVQHRVARTNTSKTTLTGASMRVLQLQLVERQTMPSLRDAHSSAAREVAAP